MSYISFMVTRVLGVLLSFLVQNYHPILTGCVKDEKRWKSREERGRRQRDNRDNRDNRERTEREQRENRDNSERTESA